MYNNFIQAHTTGYVETGEPNNTSSLGHQSSVKIKSRRTEESELQPAVYPKQIEFVSLILYMGMCTHNNDVCIPAKQMAT